MATIKKKVRELTAKELVKFCAKQNCQRCILNFGSWDYCGRDFFEDHEDVLDTEIEIEVEDHAIDAPAYTLQHQGEAND